MNSSTNTSESKKPEIVITGDKTNEDGSITIEYVCNSEVLRLCAEELEKEVTKLTKEEIHNFVMFSIGSAVKCQDGWKKRTN